MDIDSKNEIASFDPNAASTADSGVFGLPVSSETATHAAIHYIPVAWEATTSYRGGTSSGPAAILEASRQVDLFDLDVDRPYRAGLYWQNAESEPEAPVARWNREAKPLAQKVLKAWEEGHELSRVKNELERVNALSESVNQWVDQQTDALLQAGKIPAIVGGDHSTPLGALRAVGRREKEFGILHLDAHSDTRKAFEGFKYSHASILYNALEEIPSLKKVVQVGIRDFCEEEIQYCASQKERVQIFFDRDLARQKIEGKSFAAIAASIISALPARVWISFDIDGLDPRFCPNTGTPVPGGLDYSEALFLFEQLARSGREIVGFDLNEVSPGDPPQGVWDAIVGARMLYAMTAWTLVSQKKIPLRR